MSTTYRVSTRALTALACAGLASLVTARAEAGNPSDPPQPPAVAATPGQITTPSIPGLGGVTGDKDHAGPLAEKPSLIKELPIASYITAPLSGLAGGLIFKLLGGQAIDDLKDPTKHKTPDETHKLVVKARAGQAVGAVMFAFTGLSTAWGTFKTVRTLMKFSKMAKDPQKIGLTAGILPGGVAFGLKGEL